MLACCRDSRAHCREGEATARRAWRHGLHLGWQCVQCCTGLTALLFVLGTVLPGTLVAVALGVTPEAGAVGGILGYALGVFPHLNVKTPRWLGYVLQRPEMHAVHHERGVHAYNYGVLAFSDLLFGTWRNPAGFSTAPLGFWDGASARVGAMLLGRDVSRP